MPTCPGPPIWPRGGTAPGITLVPDRYGNGTNVIALPTDAGFQFSYGPGSFARHRAEAQRLGLPLRVLDLPDLAWDVDEPGDMVPVATAGPPPDDRVGGPPATGPTERTAGGRSRSGTCSAPDRSPSTCRSRPGAGHRRPPRRHRVRCGATLAKWAAAGCRLHHLVLTDGSKGSWDPDADLDALVATREAGVPGRGRGHRRSDGRAIGPTATTGCASSAGWTASSSTTSTSAGPWPGSSAQLRPDVLVGHDPWRRYRLHPDHRAAGFLILDALVAARDPHFFPELGLEPHRPEALLLFEADLPNHVEDASGFESQKVDALLCHHSQYESTMGIAGMTKPSGRREQRSGYSGRSGGGGRAPGGRWLRRLRCQGQASAGGPRIPGRPARRARPSTSSPSCSSRDQQRGPLAPGRPDVRHQGPEGLPGAGPITVP